MRSTDGSIGCRNRFGSTPIRIVDRDDRHDARPTRAAADRRRPRVLLVASPARSSRAGTSRACRSPTGSRRSRRTPPAADPSGTRRAESGTRRRSRSGPGRPIDDSVMIRNAATRCGIDLLQPAELGDQPRVPAVRQHADDEEQAAGADAVVRASGRRRPARPARSWRADAEHDEAQVADARIRHELLHVRLHHRDERAVDDADHRQRRRGTARSTRRPPGTAETRSARDRRCPSSAARRPESPSRRSAPRRARPAATCGTETAAP